MKKSTGPKKAKPPKRVNYELIARATEPAMYELLNMLVENVHDHLTNARIALAWRKALKPDADGKLILGRAKKASDLDREIAPYDFVIILNKEFWTDARTKEEQRTALMDHELSHCEVELDDNGEPKVDEKDRICYRIRKHDIEEFRGVVERNGIYKRDLELFAKTLRGRIPQADLFEPEPGEKKVVNFTGPKAVQ
jgi:hypothetical protein